ncbi:cytochrome c oxidase assembly protein [Zhongshania sp.]|jgi:cytochrome c oxidase assembly protein subunit 11|uniref:cytochrome c oxidase assembly protein n=1 Tax=Zhongshania sp. TaxID=1971902 RepID=UPI002A7F736C|nr:cytochrome c oxidase assembly protein [Zhongshania sp.]
MAQATDKNIAKLSFKLLGLVVVMFAFAMWVMPPLYNALCEVLGINGKTGRQYTVVDSQVDTSRTVKVQFVAQNNEAMPWEFSPNTSQVVVHPGESATVTYYAKNTQDRYMVSQAIPSLVPSRAAEYFHKTECFCFNQQPLAAGANADLALQFIVDRDLPKDIHVITLSYTIFDVTEMAAKQDSVAAASK